MEWEALVAIAKSMGREDLFEKIDAEVRLHPDLAKAGNRCKAVLDQLYGAVGEGDDFVGQMGEVFERIRPA